VAGNLVPLITTHAKFARLVCYSHEFVKASHIFLENGLWRVSASLASPRNTARQVSASLASLCNTAWQMSASLASPRNKARRMSSILASPRNTAGRMSVSLGSHNINTKRAENASASTRASTCDIRKIRTRKIRCRVTIA
jgi:hypothetical protein